MHAVKARGLNNPFGRPNAFDARASWGGLRTLHTLYVLITIVHCTHCTYNNCTLYLLSYNNDQVCSTTQSALNYSESKIQN